MKVATPGGFGIELPAEEAETLITGFLRGGRRPLTGLTDHQPGGEKRPGGARRVAGHDVTIC